MPRRMRNGASTSLAAAISSAWRRTSSAREALDGADRGRVVADRQVVVAAVAGGAAHLLDARAAVGPGGVACAGRRGCRRARQPRRPPARRRLAQLGRPPRDAERARRPPPRRARRGAGRGRRRTRRRRWPDERGPEPLGRGDDELDRDALDREADRAALARSSSATTCGSAAKRVRTGRGSCRGAHDREVLAGVAPAPRVARPRSPPSPPRSPPSRSRRAVEQQPLPGPRLLARGRATRAAAPRCFGPTPGTSAGGRRARRRGTRRGPHVERAGELQRALRAQPEVAAEADEVRRELALELGQLGDRARLDELAQPAPRCSRPMPAQLPDPPGAHEVGDGGRRAADGLRRPPVGARAVRVRLGELEQARERLQPVGDLRVVHG